MNRREFCRGLGLAALGSLLPLPLTACSDSGSRSFTWFVEALADNLDPQIAAGTANILACSHLFSGLVRRDASGALALDAAESYSAAADGRQYTFVLKAQQFYRGRRGEVTDYPVTAADFVFAFQRLFTPGTGSPYADRFLCLANAAEALAGRAAPETIGVSAPDALHLQFTLTAPDGDFLPNLALCGAAPCNRAFFESTQGAYGLTMANTIGNGPFYLYNWTTSGLFLRREDDGLAVTALRLVENSDTTGKSPAELVAEGRCAAILSDENPEGQQAIAYQTQCWCLLFQCGGVFGSQRLRQALALAALEAPFSPPDSDGAAGLVPPSIHCGDVYYRQAAGDLPALQGDANALFQAALAEIDPTALQGLSILVPEGSAAEEYASRLNAEWQARFSVFCTIRAAGQQDFASALQSGAYAIALAPLESTEDSPLGLLAQWENGGLCRWNSAEYTAALADCRGSGEPVAAALRAEQLLVEGAAATPLCWPRRYLLVDNRLSGLVFDPFGPRLDVTYATLN